MRRQGGQLSQILAVSLYVGPFWEIMSQGRQHVCWTGTCVHKVSVTLVQVVVVASCLSPGVHETLHSMNHQQCSWDITDPTTVGLGALWCQRRTPVRFLLTRVGLLPCGQDRHEAVFGDIPLLELVAVALTLFNCGTILTGPSCSPDTTWAVVFVRVCKRALRAGLRSSMRPIEGVTWPRIELQRSGKWKTLHSRVRMSEGWFVAEVN